MKENRYEAVCKTVKANKVHYLEAIATVNKDLAEEKQEQIAFFEGFNELKMKKIDNTVEELLNNINYKYYIRKIGQSILNQNIVLI